MNNFLIVFAIFFLIIFIWFLLAAIIEFCRGRNRSIQAEWARNNKEKARSMLASDIIAAKKHVYILSGSANEEIYDNDEVLQAFKNAVEDRKIKIKILFSEKDTSAKKLQKLGVGEENLEIISSDVIPKTHFRTVDSKCVYMEKPHDDNSEAIREFKYIKNDPLAGHLFEEKFESLFSTCRQ